MLVVLDTNVIISALKSASGASFRLIRLVRSGVLRPAVTAPLMFEYDDVAISVNQLISSALAEKLSALDAERYLSERAERGKNVDIDAILAKIPVVEPEPRDRIPE